MVILVLTSSITVFNVFIFIPVSTLSIAVMVSAICVTVILGSATSILVVVATSFLL